jgi:hypothetical protein
MVTWMVALAACGSKLPTATLDVAGHPVDVEVAHTYEARQLGLMHRDALGADDGMLFVYKNEEIRRFWMKDTRIPLSIAFLNRHGEVVRIADMAPFDQKSTTSLVPATYALEMNQGWFAAHGVEVGAKVTGIPADLKAE